MKRAPIHPISAVILIMVDSLWTLADWEPLWWIITIPLSFVACFIPVFLVQKFIQKDGMGRAAAIAGFLAVLAAVPMPITGTVVGTLVLAWAGLGPLARGASSGQSARSDPPPQLNGSPPP